ncbi:hypothetical protein JYK00_06395 [Thermosipho ferrireducens]|uniref:Uncharacterized protein n=1 Tax=Thermosipho ferrireducens TaxID=2571116 RepID=A0ABX7S7W6_9BACT|nr:hypothetical protein [Thermosipho ferrireducens]QTA37368.1 hypothetical protein JYK00_06395 [Thermosipho ferrireducens]
MRSEKVQKFLKVLLKPSDMFYETFIDVKNGVWTYVLMTIFDTIYLYKVADMIVPLYYDKPSLSFTAKFVILLIVLYMVIPFEMHKKDFRDKEKGLTGSLFFLSLYFEVGNFMNIHIFLIGGRGDIVYRIVGYAVYMGIVIVINPLNKRKMFFRFKRN